MTKARVVNTSYLHLNKPQGTDYVRIGDLNENADIIDQAMKTANDSTKEVDDKLTDHMKNDVQHNIFTMGGKRYQSRWEPTGDMEGLKFIYTEVKK